MAEYECEVCDVAYNEIRGTFLNGSTDSSATVGVAFDPATREIKQVATSRMHLNATRVIFDEWGWGQIRLIHQINTIIPGRPPAPDQFVCCEFINQVRLPPYVWRDDMDHNQEIVVVAGRWLGTRGTARKRSDTSGWDLKLTLAPGKTNDLYAQVRGSFGWTFRDDDKTNVESVLPMALRFPPGTLVWASEHPKYAPVMGHIIRTGMGPDGPLYAVQQLNSNDRFTLDEIRREVTDAERDEYNKMLMDD